MRPPVDMIVLVLLLILAGSLSGAAAMWWHDAPWWQIALGYVGGGWAGLLIGLPVTMAVRGSEGRSESSCAGLRDAPKPFDR